MGHSSRIGANNKMGRQIRQVLVIALSLGLGVIFLALYKLFIGKVYEIPLFVAAVIAITLGINRFALLLERLIRRTDEVRFPFARILYPLIPCVFGFYQFYLFKDNDFVSRLILSGIILILTFSSLYLFTVAISHTPLAHRRINIFYGAVGIVAFCFLTSLFTNNIGVLLLLPLSLMLLWTEAMQFRFFRDLDRQYYFRTVWITGTLSIAFITLLILNLLTSEIISTIYDSTIIIYMALLTITGAFTVYVLTQRSRGGFTTGITLPLQGLALFCLVLTGVTVFGILTGTQLGSNIFTQGTTLGTVFSTALSTMTLFRVLIIYFVLISFPFTFIYSYAIIRQSLTNPNV